MSNNKITIYLSIVILIIITFVKLPESHSIAFAFGQALVPTVLLFLVIKAIIDKLRPTKKIMDEDSNQKNTNDTLE